MEIFSPDSRTATISVFIGPPLFLPVEDRWPVDFAMSDNGLFTNGAKSLPEAMLINHQWGLVAFTWGQFLRKYSRYHSWYEFENYFKFILKSINGVNELIKKFSTTTVKKVKWLARDETHLSSSDRARAGADAVAAMGYACNWKKKKKKSQFS